MQIIQLRWDLEEDLRWKRKRDGWCWRETKDEEFMKKEAKHVAKEGKDERDVL